jgi:hypothetical protein
MTRRPLGIWAAAVGLVAVALAALAIGALMTFVSGMTPPANPLFAMIGLTVAGGCAVAAVGVWTPRLSRAAILVLAGMAPLACLLGTLEGSDFEALAVIAIIGWVGLGLILYRPSPAAWFAGAERVRLLR